MKGNKNNLKKHSILFILSLIVLVSGIAKTMLHEESDIEIITYNEFMKLVDHEKVDTVIYTGVDEYMTITLLNDETKDMTREDRDEYEYSDEEKRLVLYPAHDTFRKDLLEKDVNLKLLKNSNDTLVNILSLLVSVAVPVIWVFIIMRMFKSSAKGLEKKNLIQKSDVKFADVIGQDEVLKDISFITELMRNKNIGVEIGAKVPKGVLLSGEPGTGKTLIAKAVAGEAGVPFLYVNSSSLVEMYVGLGAKRVRELFKIARENSPCILFFDEVDALGAKRGNMSGTSEHEQTLNALLQEMDGFTGREGVFIIAATNRPDQLDSAFVRAGRFDRRININVPSDWKVRKQLFEFYLKNFKVDDSVNSENLARQVSGFTGADISTICNEASLIAVMSGKKAIDMDCMEEALDKKVFNGNRSNREQLLEDKRIVAYHEAGHAVMTWLQGLGLTRASIIGTTSGVGGAVFTADSESCFMTNIEMKKHILVAYAGRASEEIKFGVVTTGASNDIAKATSLIYNYIETYGFDKEFGLLCMDILQDSGIAEPESSFNRISNTSKEFYSEAIDTLRKNYDKVELLAERLLEVETLSGTEINAVLG